ncbi:MAG: M24 family metallopeptidase [Planctomycetaceae bacterium]
MPPERYLARQDKLLNLIHEAEVDALLVTGVSNVRYLTGFSGDSSALLIGPSVRVLISDSRYQTQIAEECPGLEADIRTQKTKPHEQMATVVAKARPGKLAVESHILSVHELAKAKEAIEKTDVGKSIEIKPLAETVERLRQIKDDDEIAETRLAIRVAEQAFVAMRATLNNELTERQLAHELEHTMRRLGADRAAFEPIIAVGDRSALPHYRSGERRIGESTFVLVDWGAALPSGYRSDLTRVFATDTVPRQLQELHGVVRTAQLAGIAAIHPGAKLVDVDSAARRVIEEAGYGEFFGHGLGHGIGLHIHEEPRMNSVAEGELHVGNIVTVEPGIYLPEVGGVRIEDDVLVTPDGHEVLSSLPKELGVN